ncbi:Carbon monoxide-responsive transcriptional activator CooA [Rhodovulum sp. P5]|uniref:Crp/Fnr family transcriptional regulator n=1 Tax=Rhodovulum sp. P5 TaxID=1564506 RepID=UPI0009C228F3|nr:Crp/Fnr family transcriptional regulator [Rhodovulum sp. P5]ARE41669.1 Carbon monoxide-responsive transcriptional activator CooA [Rhodovulum sp. P5]
MDRRNHTFSGPSPHSKWLSRLEGGLRQSYGPGETIVVPETGRDRLFVLDAGLARISLNGAERELTLGYLRPGGFYVTHTRAWVQAVERCETVSWPVDAMLGLVTREPELGLAAFREVGILLSGALDLIEDLAFRPVESRLARFLLAESAAQGSEVISLIDSTEALATALGTSRQTLSTLLNKLIREGVIERADRRRIRLLQPARLKTLATVSAG